MSVQVYWNLHKDTWSIRKKKPQRVLLYAPCVVLDECTFTVQQGGRKKVIRTQQKNVHAWVTGDKPQVAMHPLDFNIDISTMREVSYNPYKHGYFYRVKDNRPIYSAGRVVMWNKRVYVD